jgi:hypothetical protein
MTLALEGRTDAAGRFIFFLRIPGCKHRQRGWRNKFEPGSVPRHKSSERRETENFGSFLRPL